jgi:hypothetical protein
VELVELVEVIMTHRAPVKIANTVVAPTENVINATPYIDPIPT